MGERITPPEGVLPASRDKAQDYLRDGREFALSHAIDLKLGLRPTGFELAVSYCASQLLKDDILSSSKIHQKVPNLRVLAPLKGLTGSNLRELELAEDFLLREREAMIQGEFSNLPDGYSLAIRQAVQGLFVIERSRGLFDGREHSQRIQEWGEQWRTEVQRHS